MDTTIKKMNGEVLKGTKLVIAEENKYKWFQMNYNSELQQQCIFI